jgi:signal transduction histidine kinase/ActR/RegA family two-component response regulator
MQVMRTGLWRGGLTVFVGIVAHVALIRILLDYPLRWTYSTVPASEEIAFAYHVVAAVAGAMLMVVSFRAGSLTIGRIAAGGAALVICAASMHDDILRGGPISIEYVIMIYLVAVVIVPFRPWQALSIGGGILGLHLLFTGPGLLVPDGAAEAVQPQVALSSLGLATVLATAVSTVLYATRRAQHRVRRDAERTLEESRDLLRRTQEVAKVGGWEYVPSTNTMRGTDAVYRIWDASPDAELSLEAALDRHPAEAEAQVREAMETALDDGTAFDVEVPLVTDAGVRKWVRIRGELRTDRPRIGPRDEPASGEPHLVGILQDVTERRKLELQLRQTQTMESVGTLAGGIAHDFNNILHATQAHIEMADDRLPPGHEARSFLNRSASGLEQAEDLANKLLTFSRPNSTTTRARLDVAHVVDDVLQLLEASIPESVTLTTDVSDGCMVDGDRDQLRQVVLNVVTNALEAMEETRPPEHATGGHRLEVRLSTTFVDADMAAQYLHLSPGTYVHLAVSDTGSGMDAATQARVFDPFFTTESLYGPTSQSMSKASQKGAGLGLAVAYSAVDAHDGDIILHSQPGEGTTVDVYLPTVGTEDGEAESAGSPAPEDTAAVDDAPRVLVVDDEASILDLEEIRLARLGYQADTCNSPEDALHVLSTRGEDYDLLLTDHVMPAMTGMDLVETLRDEGRDIPVILMSGYGAQIDEAEVREAGIQAFVRKPVDSEALVETLNQVLFER